MNICHSSSETDVFPEPSEPHVLPRDAISLAASPGVSFFCGLLRLLNASFRHQMPTSLRSAWTYWKTLAVAQLSGSPESLTRWPEDQPYTFSFGGNGIF